MDCTGGELGATARKAIDKPPDTTTFILVDFKAEGCCCGKVYRRITNVRCGAIFHTRTHCSKLGILLA